MVEEKLKNCYYIRNNEKEEGKKLQYITKLDKKKLGEYEKRLITEDVILTEERLYEHILLFHEEEYKQLRPYIKNIIENPDYIV